MAHRPAVKTTFEPEKVIQPFYTGGSVALSRDGRVLATCLGEDALLTDLKTGAQLARIEGDGETITSLSLTPSASYLVVCSRSLSMRIYSLTQPDDGTIHAELIRTLRPHTTPVSVSAIDRTGTLLCTGGTDGGVKVWDIRGGFVTHTFHGHSGVISALHFFEVDPSSAEAEERAKNQRKKKRKQSDVGEEENNQDSTLGFRLATGGQDGRIRIWNLHKRSSVATLDFHNSTVTCLDYSPQENALVSGSRDKTVMTWDARTWKVRSTIPVLELVESVGFLKDGAVIYTGGERGRIRIWAVSSGKEVTQEQEIGAETEGIVNILHYEDLPYLLSVQVDQTFVLYSLAPLTDLLPDETIPPLPVLRRISGTHDEIIDMAYVGSDSTYLALATNLEDIGIISLASLEPDSENEGPEGKYFGSDVALLKGHEDIVICMDVDWSGHWLATGAKDNTARLWRVDPENNSYTCFATFTGHTESLGAIALPHSCPPAGSLAHSKPLDHPPQFIVTGSQDKTIKRWDVSSVRKDTRKGARASYTRKAHDKDINAIDTNHNSKLFASASQDRTVKIWSIEEGEVQGVLRGHRRGVWAVRFAPKDANASIQGANTSRGLILTGSGDKTVKIWSLADYSCLLTLEGHTNSVLKVLWLPAPPPPTDTQAPARDKRGAQVASAGGDGLVKVWDVNSGELACTLDNHTDRVWALAAKTSHPSHSSPSLSASSPASHPQDSRTILVSGGGDGVITFWADTTAATASAAASRETQRVEQDQRLQNLAHAGNYRDAIALALQLDQPARLLALLRGVVEGEQEDGSLSGSKAVDEVLASLADEQLFALLLRLRDWNTNARTAPVAQRILWAIVRSYPAARLAGLRGRGSGGGSARGRVGEAKGGLRDVLDALRAYTERHYRRMEELVDESYLLDFTLREMDEVAGGIGDGDGMGVLGGEGDVVMVE